MTHLRILDREASWSESCNQPLTHRKEVRFLLFRHRFHSFAPHSIPSWFKLDQPAGWLRVLAAAALKPRQSESVRVRVAIG
jgi:hypothetical protein